jgi:hypothetical protein
MIEVVPFVLRRKFYRIRTCLFVCEMSPWVLIALEMYRVPRKSLAPSHLDELDLSQGP